MKFKAVAEFQGVSINTIQGRYRYGLDKLRSLLNGEVNPVRNSTKNGVIKYNAKRSF
jgi:hypothetical protein